MSKQPGDSAAREIVITRAFDAPRELVFEAFTDPRHVAAWWGPRGFTPRSARWMSVPAASGGW